jgi:hypothetical protein
MDTATVEFHLIVTYLFESFQDVADFWNERELNY